MNWTKDLEHFVLHIYEKLNITNYTYEEVLVSSQACKIIDAKIDELQKENEQLKEARETVEASIERMSVKCDEILTILESK
jgi:uncharacterized protein YhaN